MKSIDEESPSAMQAESDRMTRMVGDLFLLAQADAGQTIRREKVELDTLLLEVYRQMRPMAEGMS
jgi:signal transduction histidine kinase